MTSQFSIIIKVAIFTLALQSSYAQSDTAKLREIESGRPYDVWLFSKTDKFHLLGKGSLNGIFDDSLSLVRKKHNKLLITHYPVRDIDEVWLRPKGKIQRGFFIGAVAGFLVGVIVAAAEGDDPEGLYSNTVAEKIVLSAILTAPLGGLIGIGLATPKIKIPINRQKDKYLPVKDKLKTIIRPPK